MPDPPSPACLRLPYSFRAIGRYTVAGCAGLTGGVGVGVGVAVGTGVGVDVDTASKAMHAENSDVSPS